MGYLRRLEDRVCGVLPLCSSRKDDGGGPLVVIFLGRKWIREVRSNGTMRGSIPSGPSGLQWQRTLLAHGCRLNGRKQTTIGVTFLATEAFCGIDIVVALT